MNLNSKAWAMFLCLFFLVLSTCVPVRYFPEGNIQEGVASWYGEDFHGKPTSSKETYDMYDMTAAHNTLPFGTYVMVTNLNNNKSVIVRINDRGPFIEGRIIDLSYAAARILGMIGPGIIPVRIEILKDLSPNPSSRIYSVQIGSFAKKRNAVALKRRLGSSFGRVSLTEFRTGNQVYFRVRIKAKTRVEAEELARKLQQAGHIVLILEEW